MGQRRYRVSIDGRLAGYVAPGRSTEFPVDPGVHMVEASIDWVHALPLRLEVATGSRTNLSIGARPKSLFKSVAPAVIAVSVANLFQSLRGGWVGLLIFLSLVVAAILIPPLLVKDYWALLTLEPMSGPVSGSPAPATG